MQNILAVALTVLLVSGIVASVYMGEVLRLTYNVLGNLIGLVDYGETLLDNITSGKNTAIDWSGYNKYVEFANRLNNTIIEMTNNITEETDNFTNNTVLGGNDTGLTIIVDYGNGTRTEYELVNATTENGTTTLVLRPKS